MTGMKNCAEDLTTFIETVAQEVEMNRDAALRIAQTSHHLQEVTAELSRELGLDEGLRRKQTG